MEERRRSKKWRAGPRLLPSPSLLGCEGGDGCGGCGVGSGELPSRLLLLVRLPPAAAADSSEVRRTVEPCRTACSKLRGISAATCGRRADPDGRGERVEGCSG